MVLEIFFQSVADTEAATDPTIVSACYFFSSSLSLIGSGTIILSYLLVKELRRFPFSLVLFLSICDFLFSLKFFLSAFWETSTSEDTNNTVRIFFLI